MLAGKVLLRLILQLVAHISLEVPEALAMRLKEHQMLGQVRAALCGGLKGDPPSTCVSIDEETLPVKLTLGMVDWRGDFIMRAFQEVRDAAAEVRIGTDEGEEHNSIVDARSWKPR